MAHYQNSRRTWQITAGTSSALRTFVVEVWTEKLCTRYTWSSNLTNPVGSDKEGVEGKMASEPPKVLISYSHDSPEHAQHVLELANRLRADGIDCTIDQYVLVPPEGWPRWMDKQVRDSDFVVMVCTET
jgi:TIR domain